MKSVYLREFIETLKKEIKSSSHLNYGAVDYRDDEIMNSFADGSLKSLEQSLGVAFNLRGIDDGIKEMVRNNG